MFTGLLYYNNTFALILLHDKQALCHRTTVFMECYTSKLSELNFSCGLTVGLGLCKTKKYTLLIIIIIFIIIINYSIIHLSIFVNIIEQETNCTDLKYENAYIFAGMTHITNKHM